MSSSCQRHSEQRAVDPPARYNAMKQHAAGGYWWCGGSTRNRRRTGRFPTACVGSGRAGELRPVREDSRPRSPLRPAAR